MDTDLYGPPLPPKFTQSVQSDHASKHSDLESDHHLDPHSEDRSEQPKRVCSKAKKALGQEKAQGSGKVLFSVVFFRGRSVLCPYQKVH